MKQVEITVMINNRLDDVVKALVNRGFDIIRRSIIRDKYMVQNAARLTQDNILSVLSDAVILRYLNVDDTKIITQITHKHKIYDADNNVLSVDATNVPCPDLVAAEKLFANLGFETLVDVNYDVIVLAKDGIELAFQDVAGLGLMLECESTVDFTDKTDDEINAEKSRLIQMIKDYGIEITEIKDVKKAYELLKLKLG